MRTGMVIGGRYEVGGLIGRGGFGEVWEAEDRNLRRDVAVKFLTIAADAPEAVDRYAREARTLATLHHPAIVTIHDAGSLDHEGAPLPYLVMERLTGATWESEGAAGVERTGAQIAQALAHVHAAQIVHRDVKPANIMLCTGGRVVLMDFGIARDDSATRKATTTGAVFGTPAYMAPEQLARHPATPASDVYALGLVLVEQLTGQRTPARQLGAEARARIPRRLRRLLESMTSHEQEQRPSAAECAARLRAAAAGPGFLPAVPRPAGNGAVSAPLSTTARQLVALARRRLDLRNGAGGEGEQAPASGTRVMTRPPGSGDEEERRGRGARLGAAVRRLRGRRSKVELAAGGVIFTTRVIRDLLLLAAAGAGSWFLSLGVATAIEHFFEHPPRNEQGDTEEWSYSILVSLGHLIVFAIWWGCCTFVTTDKRLGRSVFAKHLVRALIVSLAPLPYLLAFEAPEWTVRAVPAGVWGGWLLYVVLRRFQKIDERARLRAN